MGTGISRSPFCKGESHLLAGPCRGYINADDVIAFCLYLMNTMWRNLIKIMSCAICGWFNRFDMDDVTAFCLYHAEKFA